MVSIITFKSTSSVKATIRSILLSSVSSSSTCSSSMALRHTSFLFCSVLGGCLRMEIINYYYKHIPVSITILKYILVKYNYKWKFLNSVHI